MSRGKDGAGLEARRAVSMMDVAQAAQVSPMTVSRVINGSDAVSQRTRQKVLAVVEDLSYRPNRAAQTLSSGYSRIVGVVSLDGAAGGPTTSLAGIEQEARSFGYTISVSILQGHDPESIAEAVQRLESQAVAGIILCVPHTALDDHLIARGSVPIVAVEGLNGHTPVVAIDQHEGAAIATRHLIELGHTRIAHIAAPADRFEGLERESGWRDALAVAGLKPGPRLRGDWSPKSGHRLTGRLLTDKTITAVFCGNDLMAIGAMRRAAEEGLTVPDDLSIVGFDDLPEAAYLRPALTTVRYDFYELGRRTLQRLLQQMRSRAGPERSTIQPKLMIRESSAPPGIQGRLRGHMGRSAAPSPASPTPLAKAPARAQAEKRARSRLWPTK